jgi:hypothetical protein
MIDMYSSLKISFFKFLRFPVDLFQFSKYLLFDGGQLVVAESDLAFFQELLDAPQHVEPAGDAVELFGDVV